MNIKTAFSLLNTLYGIEMKESDFEEIALNAWELIGTKHTELKGYVADSNDCFLKLPCDVAEIESGKPYPLTNDNTNTMMGSNIPRIPSAFRSLTVLTISFHLIIYNGGIKPRGTPQGIRTPDQPDISRVL